MAPPIGTPTSRRLEPIYTPSSARRYPDLNTRKTPVRLAPTPVSLHSSLFSTPEPPMEQFHGRVNPKFRAWRTGRGRTCTEGLRSRRRKGKTVKMLSQSAMTGLNELHRIAEQQQAPCYKTALIRHADEATATLGPNQLRRALTDLNVVPTADLIQALLEPDGKPTHHSQIGNAIDSYLMTIDQQVQLGKSNMPRVPFAVPADANQSIAEMVAGMKKKWGFVRSEFDRMDVHGTGLMNLKQFSEAIKTACPRACLSVKEAEAIFADADISNRGQLSFEDFKKAFAKGSLLVPEFAKPVSIRQSRGGPIFAVNPLPAGSNASREFEFKDSMGVTRFHCKHCHLYLLPKEFSTKCIKLRMHICDKCMAAMEDGFLPGRHCRTQQKKEWPAQPGQFRHKLSSRGHPATKGCLLYTSPSPRDS
eukprot:TRINITY_DN3031_c0_g2_i8.p1 TRINITY_DN3031_c0_g2~~TRINITY_DN3031_c0_g2_i8.p1  ORF type:complete len:419 (-),score=76.97 TRINITY_DN3031_c0_g2_i8:168-1424(-)